MKRQTPETIASALSFDLDSPVFDDSMIVPEHGGQFYVVLSNSQRFTIKVTEE